MSRLEERYRSVLRVLPTSYREVWEDEMVATFVESMQTDDAESNEFVADYGRPSWSEVTSVAALAIWLRLGGADAPPRSAAWGEAIRRVALVGLLTHAAMASIGIGITLWLLGVVPLLPAAPTEWAQSATADPWHTAWSLAEVAWVFAYLALVLGHPRTARGLTLLAIAPAAAASISSLVRGEQFLITRWFDLLLYALLVLALMAFHRDAPPVRRQPWLVALPAGIVVVASLFFLGQPAGLDQVPLLDLPGLWSVVLVTVAALYLAGPRVGWARTASWSLALALLAGAVLAMRIVSLPDYLLYNNVGVNTGLLVTLGLIEAAAVVAVGVPLAKVAARALHDLPSLPASSVARSEPAP